MIAVRQLRQIGPRPGDFAKRERRVADARQFRTLVERASSLGHTPEGKLWIAVLSLVWSEARTDGHIGARDFFTKGRAQTIADMIGFEGNIAQIFRDHHVKGAS